MRQAVDSWVVGISQRKRVGELRFILARWSLFNAVTILSAVAVTWASASFLVVPLAAGFSFSGLILCARPHWTGTGAFGWANTVTALRLLGVLTLPIFYPLVAPNFAAFVGAFLLVTDGLDGWLARRRHEASEFGEYFDKETDALFLLVLCILAVLDERLWRWVLILGLFRYAFLILIRFLSPNVLKEEKSARARITYGFVMGAMLLSFLPYPGFYKPLVVMGVMALILSFTMDFTRGVSPSCRRN
ncbi:MAG: CDP-alcohol phosphatidyltransferase [Proteobacteria bacterium]|nr:CDP-alcohol phosphatidyltransferase [Pseudomonadota bacterium]